MCLPFQANLAYKRLVGNDARTGRNEWAYLVPVPMFISESPSGMVRFLGLQKGRQSVPRDGTHEEKVVVIDLECWEEVPGESV